MKCLKCGTENEENTSFCRNCGSVLNLGQSEQIPIQPEQNLGQSEQISEQNPIQSELISEQNQTQSEQIPIQPQQILNQTVIPEQPNNNPVNLATNIPSGGSSNLKKIIIGILILVLLIGIGIVGYKFLFSNKEENEIKKLNVELEKYELPCTSGTVCDEIKGKIVQFVDYTGKVNDDSYEEIILTNDGHIYLYNSTNEKLVKIVGDTKLTHIEGTVPGTAETWGENAVIYQNENYYKIALDGTIKEYEFEADIDTFLGYIDGKTYFWAVDKNKTLSLYLNCSRLDSGECSPNEKWLKTTPANDNFLKNIKIKYANVDFFITDDNKVYPTNKIIVPAYSGFSINGSNTYILSFLNDSFLKDELLMSNPKNYWYWDYDDSSYGYSVIQASDKNLYSQLEIKIPFSENVENILFSTHNDFLIIGQTNVYLALDNYDDGVDLVKLDELQKYKNDIRAIHIQFGTVYALLSDGNFYKIYEDK